MYPYSSKYANRGYPSPSTNRQGSSPAPFPVGNSSSRAVTTHSCPSSHYTASTFNSRQRAAYSGSGGGAAVIRVAYEDAIFPLSLASQRYRARRWGRQMQEGEGQEYQRRRYCSSGSGVRRGSRRASSGDGYGRHSRHCRGGPRRGTSNRKYGDVYDNIYFGDESDESREDYDEDAALLRAEMEDIFDDVETNTREDPLFLYRTLLYASVLDYQRLRRAKNQEMRRYHEKMRCATERNTELRLLHERNKSRRVSAYGSRSPSNSRTHHRYDHRRSGSQRGGDNVTRRHRHHKSEEHLHGTRHVTLHCSSREYGRSRSRSVPDSSERRGRGYGEESKGGTHTVRETDLDHVPPHAQRSLNERHPFFSHHRADLEVSSVPKTSDLENSHLFSRALAQSNTAPNGYAHVPPPQPHRDAIHSYPHVMNTHSGDITGQYMEAFRKQMQVTPQGHDVVAQQYQDHTRNPLSSSTVGEYHIRDNTPRERYLSSSAPSLRNTVAEYYNGDDLYHNGNDKVEYAHPQRARSSHTRNDYYDSVASCLQGAHPAVSGKNHHHDTYEHNRQSLEGLLYEIDAMRYREKALKHVLERELLHMAEERHVPLLPSISSSRHQDGSYSHRWDDALRAKEEENSRPHTRSDSTLSPEQHVQRRRTPAEAAKAHSMAESSNSSSTSSGSTSSNMCVGQLGRDAIVLSTSDSKGKRQTEGHNDGIGEEREVENKSGSSWERHASTRTAVPRVSSAPRSRNGAVADASRRLLEFMRTPPSPLESEDDHVKSDEEVHKEEKCQRLDRERCATVETEAHASADFAAAAPLRRRHSRTEALGVVAVPSSLPLPEQTAATAAITSRAGGRNDADSSSSNNGSSCSVDKAGCAEKPSAEAPVTLDSLLAEDLGTSFGSDCRAWRQRLEEALGSGSGEDEEDEEEG